MQPRPEDHHMPFGILKIYRQLIVIIIYLVTKIYTLKIIAPSCHSSFVVTSSCRSSSRRCTVTLSCHRAVVSFTVASSSCCHHVVAASLSLSCSSSSPYCLVALFIIAVLLCCSAVVFIVVLSSPRCVCRRLRHVVAVLSCHCLCGIVVHHHIRRVFIFIALFLLHLRLRRVVVHLIFVTLLFYFVFVIFIAPLWWSSSLLSVTRESVVLAVERWPQQQFCM